ncbi:MAG: right-handed parallel beta-helix repeat-containing protein [Candidatus Micrarchaeota archaeon]
MANEQVPGTQLQGKKEPDRLEKPDYLRWGIIAVVLIFVIIFSLVYYQSSRESGMPSPSPTYAPTATPLPTQAPLPTIAPTATDEPIPTIVFKEPVACGRITKSVTLNKDITTRESCFVVGAEDVTIDCAGFAIYSKSTENTTGVYTEYANTKVKNCAFDSFEIGVRLFKADGSSVESSTFSNNMGGVLVERLKGASVEKSTFINSTQVGIYMASVTDSKIIDNFMDNSIKYGLQMVSSDRNTIRNNQIFRNNFGMQLTQSKDNLFEGNNMSFNSAGLKIVAGSSGNVFKNNLVYYSRGIGVHITDFSNDNVFQSNSFIQNEYGINIRDSNEILVNNYICDNTIEDVECNKAQANATGNTCFTRAIYCGFDCAARCPNAKVV